MNDKNTEVEQNQEESQQAEKKKRMPQHAIDKMNAALEAGMTPGAMEDAIYKEMFGCED